MWIGYFITIIFQYVDRYAIQENNSLEPDNSILGSGNFEILKGGTFYDKDDYRRPFRWETNWRHAFKSLIPTYKLWHFIWEVTFTQHQNVSTCCLLATTTSWHENDWTLQHVNVSATADHPSIAAIMEEETIFSTTSETLQTSRGRPRRITTDMMMIDTITESVSQS